MGSGIESPPRKSSGSYAPGKAAGNTLIGFKDVRAENGSSQGQNLALTASLCAKSPGSGPK